MALFGSDRDFSFFKKINNELVTDIIDTSVAFYKIIKSSIDSNVYDENINIRNYNNPVLISAIIDRDPKNYKSEEFGVDYDENIKIAFFKPHLEEKNIYIEIGDIIEYDNKYYELIPIQENQYFMGKKSSTWFGEGHGDSVSIICDAHIINREMVENNRNY
jgi:hypothetical protein